MHALDVFSQILEGFFNFHFRIIFLYVYGLILILLCPFEELNFSYAL